MLKGYQDIVYVRYLDEKEKVVRVARAETHEGAVLALCPSNDRDIFHMEAFRDPDDPNDKTEIRRDEIKDTIWLRLLDGEAREAILKDYEGDSYCRKGAPQQKILNSRTFRISEDKRESA